MLVLTEAIDGDSLPAHLLLWTVSRVEFVKADRVDLDFLTATFMIGYFYIIFYIFFRGYLFFELDVMLRATAQKVTFLFLFLFS